MEGKSFDVAVIGSGPGGYVAAIRAAQKGKSVALIEAREVGGTCLNRGCIPSKALIANAETLRKIRSSENYGIKVGNILFDYKNMKESKDKIVERIRKGLEGLIASNHITILQGYGKFISPHEIKILGPDEGTIKVENIIIATGSEPKELPIMPFNYKNVHDSTSLLEITELPKKMLIIGGGVIGCEFASLYNALDVDVTIIELLPSILSMEGTNVADALTRSFKKRGIHIETNVVIDRVHITEKNVSVHLTDGKILEGDSSLVCVGRKYNSDNLGLETTGVIIEDDGSIPVDEKMQTNTAHIYAIGDVTGKWILAHVASHQGMIAADNIAGKPCVMNYNAVPSVIFTYPEIGTIGYTLERAVSEGFDATIGKFPFQALGKSQATHETEGFAQIVISKSTGQILGAQVVGHEAATLIAEMAIAIGNELTVHSINETIHAHPTIAEAWMEAAFSASDMPLHLPPLPRT